MRMQIPSGLEVPVCILSCASGTLQASSAFSIRGGLKGIIYSAFRAPTNQSRGRAVDTTIMRELNSAKRRGVTVFQVELRMLSVEPGMQ